MIANHRLRHICYKELYKNYLCYYKPLKIKYLGVILDVETRDKVYSIYSIKRPLRYKIEGIK